ncbi:hypothetical protein IX39_02455 [Chryseobacterium formosense]|uniref:Transmembrane signal peptide protein n=1 Tax=Chryseobacterium formosense TaxID=236814 RepID=A0A085Z533_9FLAO|nr:DUF2207 domain-containing protein [Chryseobacterium formosense]KFE99546.1 hypothetical protein IX39_02455 [Chryseobacterium formosense]SFT80973.1 Predicted membrane protein [Chryseobacterium formosense]
MKKLIAFLFLLFFSLGFSQHAEDLEITPPADVEYSLGTERIINFHSNIDVDKNSGLSITENIKVHSLGQEIKRGIFRTLPLVRNLNDRTQKVKYNVVSVKKNGVEEDYHEEIEDGFLKIYIGNKDIILSPGDYDYEIKYTTEKQIGFFEKYDELYWNVNGNEWNFPVDSISATVNLPQGASIIQNSCYKGAYGSNSQDCLAKIISDHSIEWGAKDLSSGEGLTIAVGFKKGIMIPPPPPTFIEKFGILIVGIVIFLALLIYYYTTWRKYGVDPEMPTVYPQFNSPDDLSPASLGFINNETFKNKYLTAALVSLAVKGYVQIIESEDSGVFGLFKSKKFTVKKLKNQDQNLPKEEVSLMNSLFTGGLDHVEFDGKYDPKIEQAVRSFEYALKFQHDKLLNEGNNTRKIFLPLILITIMYGLGLFFSFKIFPEGEKVFVGGVLYVILLIAFLITGFLFKLYPVLFKIFLVIPAVLLVSLGGLMFAHNDFTINDNFNICYIFIILGFTSLIIYQFLIRRPSEEKLRKKSLIAGFKMYMGAAENQQLKFHNPPEMTPQSFEKLLPFAMVLGVDEIWGKKFDDLLKKMSATDYQSNWYVGSTMNHFAMASVLNSSLTQSIQSSATQPSSSGSSSGSGSGGGGFSGGGGGGGGGGGW